MKPAARINETIVLLEKIQASRIPMDATIGDHMRFRRYIGSKDRAAIVERLYGITRAWARLGWWLARAGAADTPRHRTLAWLALEEKIPLAEIASLANGEQYAPAPLSEDEEKFLSLLAGHELTTPDMPDAVRAECPARYEESLRGYFGDDFSEEMNALMVPASLDLRVNTRSMSREEAQKSLKADGVATDATQWSPWGLRARSKAFLSKTKAFVKGWVEIQDEGSQLIAWLCAAKPGQQVLDYCAGAGGKTLALAAAMQNKGRIVAMDTEESRLQKGRQRFKRAGVSDIIEVRPLTDEKNRKWLRRQKECFDAVLADVPCSGTGTWRRNPDLRWRDFGPTLESLITTQAEILDKVAKTVKPGGRLVYATCSLLPEENEKQAAAFLARHPAFEIMPLDQAWPEGAAPDAGDFMRLTPRRHNTDGFFAAVFQRTASSSETPELPAED